MFSILDGETNERMLIGSVGRPPASTSQVSGFKLICGLCGCFVLPSSIERALNILWFEGSNLLADFLEVSLSIMLNVFM